MKKLTREEFVNKANKKHNNFFDYSKVNYVCGHKKVTIICPSHGEFEQVPSSHLSGCGCEKCKHDNMKNNNYIFIKKASKVHNGKYDYSKVNYIDNKKNVTIICPEHGEFEQRATYHLQGLGCSKCFKQNIVDNFIYKSLEIHRNYYKYSKANYINNSTKVTIICPSHGEFEQTPANHLKGRGCSKCKLSKGELKIKKLLEYNNINFEPQKTFDDCRGKKKELPFDFYLPDYNLCIEYQGEHHYKIIEFWGGEIKYEERIKTDNLKRKYCINHNIKLIEIPYWETDVQKVLNDILVQK